MYLHRQERSSSSWRRKEALRQHEASSLLSQTAAQLLSTWDTTTRIFSKYYLGEGTPYLVRVSMSRDIRFYRFQRLNS